MCTITATEWKKNFGKYMELALTEDIIITKNGKPNLKVSNVKSDSFERLTNHFIGAFNEEDADFNDPRIAHMLGKL